MEEVDLEFAIKSKNQYGCLSKRLKIMFNFMSLILFISLKFGILIIKLL